MTHIPQKEADLAFRFEQLCDNSRIVGNPYLIALRQSSP